MQQLALKTLNLLKKHPINEMCSCVECVVLTHGQLTPISHMLFMWSGLWWWNFYVDRRASTLECNSASATRIDSIPLKAQLLTQITFIH